MTIVFPNVPLVPGVPAVPRNPLLVAVAEAVTLLTADSVFLPPNGSTQWGIFLNGVPVILADNVVTMDFKQDYHISNYPVEGGAFRSYDKVMTPFEAKLRFSTGGSVADRQNFINSITQIIGDTNVYDVYTPEQIYPSVNLVHWDFARAAQNVGLLSIDIWVEQVSVTATQTFQNVKNPTSNSPVSGGPVSPNELLTGKPALVM